MKLRDRKRLQRLMTVQDVSARQLARAAGWKSHSYMNRLLNGQAETLAPEITGPHTPNALSLIHI